MSECDKVGYATRQLAIDAIKEISRRDQQSMKVYSCGDCNEFHIATKGKRKLIPYIKHGLSSVKFNPKNPHGRHQKDSSIGIALATGKMISKEMAAYLKRLIEGNNQLNKQKNK